MFFWKQWQQKKKTAPAPATVWFCRIFGSDWFVRSDSDPLQTPPLLLSHSPKGEKCFCPIHCKWEPVTWRRGKRVQTGSCSLSGMTVCYREPETRSQYIPYWGSELFRSVKQKEIALEELEGADFVNYIHEYKTYLAHRAMQENLEAKRKQKLKQQEQNTSMHKDIFLFKVCTDSSSLRMTITQYAVNSAMLEHDFPYIEHQISQVPLLTYSEFYDVKKGCCQITRNPGKKLGTDKSHASSIYYPASLYSYCEGQLQGLIQRFLGRSIYFAPYTPPKDESSIWQLENQGRNTSSLLGDKLRALVYFPYEPALYFSLQQAGHGQLENEISFQRYRLDSNCYQNYCQSLGFTSYRTLKKLFYKNPSVLLSCSLLKACGFTDVNIINRILTMPDLYDHLFSREGLTVQFFLQWAIPLKGEKGAWRLVEKGIPKKDYWYELHDALRMFRNYFTQLDYSVRTAILRDGLSSYNHDLLSNVVKKIQQTNVVFPYSAKEKALEDEIDGYRFRLPTDYDQLVDIATALHNCVASYRQRILDKSSLIVYAEKDGAYRLCIEVRGTMVHQQRCDRNGTPTGSDSRALQQWRKKHALLFRGNYY